MAVILLPSLLAEQAGGRKEFETAAGTVGAALRELPVADLLFDESGELRPLVNVYLDGTDVRESGGLEAEVSPGATLRIVQAVAGGW
jgi:molybdopterin synthase sulfur carrier subunit